MSHYLKVEDCDRSLPNYVFSDFPPPRRNFTVPVLQVILKCRLFQSNPTLLGSPYRVQTSVSLSVFREFLSALEGNSINITDTNFTELHHLCEEFNFTELSAKLSEFRPSMDFNESGDANSSGRIANQHYRLIAMLQSKVRRLSTDFGRLVGEVSALRSDSARIQTLSEEVSSLKRQIRQKQNDPVVEQLSTDFIELRKEVSTLKAQILVMPPQLSPEQPSVPLFKSQIISELPKIFEEFEGKHFKILWRGSRHGFEAEEFHRRCDGHANTLTVILDTKGNIFGGFTPVEWESPEGWAWKPDDSLKSFIFTLKNPHNIPARKFPIKAERKDLAIFCDSREGSCFNGIAIFDNCNARTTNRTYNGSFYSNDAGMGADVFFTGSAKFQVKEIEIFEITD
jgi:hypothetical protein